MQEKVSNSDEMVSQIEDSFFESKKLESPSDEIMASEDIFTSSEDDSGVEELVRNGLLAYKKSKALRKRELEVEYE